VKVLDFGLAKAIDGPATRGASGLTMSPTLSVHATYVGVILGTAAYMSPEQARGKPIDRRTDVWAFGCVLYEMLTGVRAFDGGETVSDAVAAILRADVDWRRLPEETPPHVRALLARCLQKDPQKRLPHIGVARLDLDEAIAAPAAPLNPAVTTRFSRERAVWAAIAMALAATSAALAFVAWRRPAAIDPPEMRVEIATSSSATGFAVSPDGRRIVYVAVTDGRNRLWLRNLDETAARPLAGTDGASMPFWSPDGRSIGFFAAARLRRVDVDGGSVQVLTTIMTP